MPNQRQTTCCIARRVEAAEYCLTSATLILWVRLAFELTNTRFIHMHGLFVKQKELRDC